MEIEAKKLEQLLSILLQHQKELGNTKFTISQDYYWNVPKDDRYDPYTQPSELTLGQLTDDWSRLQNLFDDNEAIVGYSLVWLGNVLRAIGENYVR